MNRPATVLVVDDHEANRLLLHDLLVACGHIPLLAENGLSALARIRRDRPDVVLLDILMPEMNGFEVLQRLRTEGLLHGTPVIVVSSVDDLDSIVQCIQAGAEDYLIKPFNHTLLRARLESSLEKKRLRDHERHLALQLEDYNLRLEARVAEQVRQITTTELERARLSRYLSPSLVEAVLQAERPLDLGGAQTRVTVLFTDIRGYTRLSQQVAPRIVMELLNEHFTELSEIVFAHDGTLDKFIGDSLMAVFGWPFSPGDDAMNALRAATRMQEAMRIRNARGDAPVSIEIGIGINTGDVIAGNIGAPQKMDLTVIGDAVNIAARLQALARGGEVVLGEATHQALAERVRCEFIGAIELKNVLQPVRCYRVLEGVLD